MTRQATHHDMLKLDQQFCFQAYALARAVSQAYDPILEELDVTYPQYLVLLVLWEDDAQNVKALGQKLRLDSGTLTPLLKRMEAKKLISRTRSPEDERSLIVALTTAGRALKAKAAKIPKALVGRLNCTPERLVKLRDDMKAFLAAMDAAGG